MRQNKEIKQNWTTTEKCDIYFSVIFDHYYQSFISRVRLGTKLIS